MTMQGDVANDAKYGLAVFAAEGACAVWADALPDDASCVMAAIALLGRLALTVHAGDVAKAQGLINGICESAKLETLNLAAGGVPS